MKKSRIAKAKRWVDKPTTIVGSIPLNPSYLDGRVVKRGRYTSTLDRDGELMSYQSRVELSAYRELEREKWRESCVNIKDKKENG